MSRLPLAKTYAVHSMFLTLQCEGEHAGRAAVFCRFAGCNVWSGKEEDRERDALRNAVCARHCDTEFTGADEANGGGTFTAEQIVAKVQDLWPHASNPFVVMTGGEPSLQLTEELVFALNAKLGAFVAVETNGTKLLPSNVDWITLSPKPPMHIVDQRYSEVKVLFPIFDPGKFANFASRRFISPVQPREGDGTWWAENTKAAVEYVLKNPSWRLSCQVHKFIGVQ